MSILGDNIRNRRIELHMTQDELAKRLGYKSRSTINKIELGINDIGQSRIMAFANALLTTPATLMGWDTDTTTETSAEDIAVFPVIGEVAAGYNKIAMEDWSGDTVEIPVSYLHGRQQSDFLVLTVHGDSMYPMYIAGDKVLVQKSNEFPRSGDIGVFLYDGEHSTIKRIEYTEKERLIRLVPINPMRPPEEIKGADVESFSVIGIPKLIIRQI